MIEQRENQLVLSFPTPEAARAFAQFLTTLVNLQDLETSEPLSDPPPLDSLEHGRSQHVLLTPERQEALFNQRQNGQSARQRLLHAQTTLKDGALPFSKPGSVPAPSGQPSPRQRAAAEGTFADGAAVLPEAKRKSKLKPAQVDPSLPGQRPPLSPRPSPLPSKS